MGTVGGLAGCGSDGPTAARVVASRVAPPRTPGALLNTRGFEQFYGAYLQEVVGGAPAQSMNAYQALTESDDSGGALAARASMRLAALRAAQGFPAAANELITAALALAAEDPEIIERADRLRARFTSPTRAPLRGPAPGAPVAGVPPEAGAALARAETLLAAYYRRSLTPKLNTRDWVEWATSISQISVEDTTLRATQSRLADAVRAYQEAGVLDRRAQVVAEFRIGSLYHDSALGLFDLPPELDTRSAARLRVVMRRRALDYLRRARGAYSRSLAAAKALPPGQSRAVKRWTLGARNGLAAVDRLDPL